MVLAPAWAAVEVWSGRRLITQTWDLPLVRFPSSECIRLWWGPVQSVTTVTYLDAAGTSQVLDPATYLLDTYSVPGRILLAPGWIWPVTQAQHPMAVTIRYVLGYGLAAAEVPDPLRLLIGAVADHFYNNGLQTPVPWDSLGALAPGYGPALGIA